MTVGWMNKLLISLQTVSERQQSHEILTSLPLKQCFQTEVWGPIRDSQDKSQGHKVIKGHKGVRKKNTFSVAQNNVYFFCI